jgi:hypothetical protein
MHRRRCRNSIDVVPERFIDETKTDSYLYQSGGARKRLNTTDVHLDHVRDTPSGLSVLIRELNSSASRTTVLKIDCEPVSPRRGALYSLGRRLGSWAESGQQKQHRVICSDISWIWFNPNISSKPGTTGPPSKRVPRNSVWRGDHWPCHGFRHGQAYVLPPPTKPRQLDESIVRGRVSGGET